ARCCCAARLTHANLPAAQDAGAHPYLGMITLETILPVDRASAPPYTGACLIVCRESICVWHMRALVVVQMDLNKERLDAHWTDRAGAVHRYPGSCQSLCYPRHPGRTYQHYYWSRRRGHPRHRPGHDVHGRRQGGELACQAATVGSL